MFVCVINSQLLVAASGVSIKQMPKRYYFVPQYISYRWFHKLMQDKMQKMKTDLKQQDEQLQLLQQDLQKSKDYNAQLGADYKFSNDEIEMLEQSCEGLRSGMKTLDRVISKKSQANKKIQHELNDMIVQRNQLLAENVQLKISLLNAQRLVEFTWQENLKITSKAQDHTKGPNVIQRTQHKLMNNIRKNFKNKELQNTIEKMGYFLKIIHDKETLKKSSTKAQG